MKLVDEIKELFVDEIQNTTAHGLGNIFRTKNIFIRVMWLVYWLAALGGTTYLMYTGISDYFKYEVNSKSRIVNERPMPFPKVTICNLDQFVTDESVTFLAEIIKENSTYWEVKGTETEFENCK